MTTRAKRAAVMILALSGAAAGAARAQSPEVGFVEARSQFELAVAAVRAGRPADAVPLFERSYAARPSPVVAVNLAFCLRGLGRFGEARGWYLRFRETASPEDLTRHGGTVEAHLEEISHRLARVELGERSPADAVVRWNDVVVGAHGLWVDPGARPVVATAGGFRPGDAMVSARAGETLRVSVRLTTVEPPITRRWWFWTAVGVALAGVTTAVLVPLLTTDPGVSDVPEVHVGP